MAATIVASSFTGGGSPQAASVTDSSILIPLSNNNWQSVRLTIRYLNSDPGLAYVTSSQYAFLGLCSGTASPYDPISNTTHAIGSYVSAWSSYGAGTGQFASFLPVKRDGVTDTTGAVKTGAAAFDTAKRMAWSILIERDVVGGGGGSATYNIDQTSCQNYAANSDYDDARYGFLTEAHYNGAVNYGQHTDAQTTIATVDENTHGTFDHAQFYWDSGLGDWEIQDFSVHVIS